MLLTLKIENYKRFENTGEIPLDKSVVFIGPNNSGKTSALQALALWHLGINKWLEKRGEKSKAKHKTGVAINRKDVFAIPTPNSKLLWFNLATKTKKSEKIFINITVKGFSHNTEWECGLSFDYFGEEVLYCRPNSEIENNILLTNPDMLREIKIAYLPPMSGLIPEEPKLLSSTVGARIGEGRTADVLRNLCYFILNPELPSQTNGKTPRENWQLFTTTLRKLFGVELNEPELNERGEVEMTYLDSQGNELDLSSSGRGLQQVMLLLAYMLTNPHALLLLDEPDAHLEILRQQQVYNLLSEIAERQGSQIISASHSEIVLREAAAKDTVIAFTGKPHRINDKGAQVMKSLTTIGFDQYYLAEANRWILYVEGPTDLDMLIRYAKKLNHPLQDRLEQAFVHYVSTNLPSRARDHFYGLSEAVPGLKGIAIFDRLETQLQVNTPLEELMWSKRELENYLFKPYVLMDFAKGDDNYDLFSAADVESRRTAMKSAIEAIIPKIALDNYSDEYWTERKASEEIERIFKEYFKHLGTPILVSKNKYHELVDFLKKEDVETEVKDKLDAILKICDSVSNGLS